MSRPRVLSDLDTLQSQSLVHAQHISSLQGSISEIQERMSVATTPISASLLPVGSEVYLYEDNVLVPFIIVQKDYINTGNTILMRKYPLPPDYLGVAVTGYIGSYLDTYLTETYQSILSATYYNILLPVSNQNGTTNSSNRSIFIPSYMELTGNTVNVSGRIVSEGSRFEYFAQGNSVICRQQNGAAVNYFMRTPYDLSNFYIVTSSGSYSFSASRDEQYIRPFVSINSNSNVYRKIFNDTSNVLATAVIT